jgi:hypothetical protein
MATLSLGSGLVEKITKKVFSDNAYIGYNSFTGSANTSVTATTTGMGGAGFTTSIAQGYSGYSGGSPVARSSNFSLMKGVVPSAIADVNTGQRTSDELVRYVGPHVTPVAVGGTNNYTTSYLLTTTSDTTFAYNSQYVTPNDFLITVTGGTATWSALNLSFLPRYPLASGTPTWFWFRTPGNEHTIIGTVGATGSGSDLELQTYGNIDATKQYTLYNATMAVFEMTQEINY